MLFTTIVKFTPLFCFFEAIVDRIVFGYSFTVCSLLVHTKATDFYKLILYPATLLKVFLMSRSFFVEIFRSFRHKIMSSALIFFLFLLPVVFLLL
jgi:hypothetical protein